MKSVTKALNILEDAGWISRVRVPKFRGGERCATWLRITLRRKTQKTPLTGPGREPRPVRPKKRIKGRTCKTQKTGRSFPTEKGGGLNGPAPTAALGSEPSRPIPYCEPQPIAGKQPVEKKTHSGGAES